MTNFTPFLGRIESLDLPPRGEPGSQQTIDRIMALFRGLGMGTEEQLAQLREKLEGELPASARDRRPIDPVEAALETLLASLDAAVLTLEVTLREGLENIHLALRDLDRR